MQARLFDTPKKNEIRRQEGRRGACADINHAAYLISVLTPLSELQSTTLRFIQLQPHKTWGFNNNNNNNNNNEKTINCWEKFQASVADQPKDL